MLANPPRNLGRPVVFAILIVSLVALVVTGGSPAAVAAVAAGAAWRAPALGVSGCAAGCEEDLRGYAAVLALLAGLLGATSAPAGTWAASALAVGLFLLVVWLRPASVREIPAE